MKKIWRKNFEIQQAEYIMMSEAIGSFYKFQKSSVDKNYLKETIMVFENGNNSATYFIKDEMRNYIKAILREVINRPLKLKRTQDKTIGYSRSFFQKLKKIEKIKFSSQPDEKLIKQFNALFRLMQLSHGYSLATTWFVDADREDLSQYLINLVKAKINQTKLKLQASEVFSILTTPAEASLARTEEREMLGILGLIIKNKTVGKLFIQEDPAKIKQGLKGADRTLCRRIISHYKKWRWTPYAYIGPAHDLDNYLSIWSSLVRQKINPKEEINKLVESRRKTIKQRHEFLKSLKLNKNEIAIFNLAAQIVWLKAFRKDVLFYGMYVIDQILKELGRRQGLALMQMKYITGLEMNNFKKFSADALNQRFKFSVMHANRGKIKIYTGGQAKDFLRKQKFGKETISEANELKGTPAYVGKVKGRVKIINLPEEMIKMESGDIMVSHTTFPSLVPAMKKAAAIVTDDGGITCHAAIVARELKTPCVVGTKFATKVLRDGMMAEVDANEGVVRIIK